MRMNGATVATNLKSQRLFTALPGNAFVSIRFPDYDHNLIIICCIHVAFTVLFIYLTHEGLLFDYFVFLMSSPGTECWLSESSSGIASSFPASCLHGDVAWSWDLSVSMMKEDKSWNWLYISGKIDVNVCECEGQNCFVDTCHYSWLCILVFTIQVI